VLFSVFNLNYWCFPIHFWHRWWVWWWQKDRRLETPIQGLCFRCFVWWSPGR